LSRHVPHYFIRKSRFLNPRLINLYDKTLGEEFDRATAIAARKEECKKIRKKKKRTASSSSLTSNTFQEIYRLTNEILGRGAYASVETCVNIYTGVEYAVKIIDKVPGHSRARVFKEVDLFYHCKVSHKLYTPSVILI
jgi:hypothetical protein